MACSPYVLYQVTLNGRLMYIGMTENPSSRAREHLRTFRRYKAEGAWSFSPLCWNRNKLVISTLEAKLIEKLMPPWNIGLMPKAVQE